MGCSGRSILAAVVAAAATALVAPGLASAGTSAPNRYFWVKAVGSGSWVADYGEDRLRTGQTQAFGIDGRERTSFRWEIQAVARGPRLTTTAARIRMRAKVRSNVVDYSIGMGVLTEDPACRPRRGLSSVQGEGYLITNDGSFVRGPIAALRGDWVSVPGAGVALRGRNLLVFNPVWNDLSQGCHRDAHARGFIRGALEGQARIPRGAFNPRFDRRYTKTFRTRIDIPADHEAEPASYHTVKGSSKIAVRIKAISERTAGRRERRFRREPRNRLR